MNESLIAEASIISREVVAGIRTVRKQKQIKQHEPLSLEIKGAHDDSLDAVLVKMGNPQFRQHREGEESCSAASFIVGAVEYSVLSRATKSMWRRRRPNSGKTWITTPDSFAGVEKKLSNERFVSNAP